MAWRAWTGVPLTEEPPFEFGLCADEAGGRTTGLLGVNLAEGAYDFLSMWVDGALLAMAKRVDGLWFDKVSPFTVDKVAPMVIFEFLMIPEAPTVPSSCSTAGDPPGRLEPEKMCWSVAFVVVVFSRREVGPFEAEFGLVELVLPSVVCVVPSPKPSIPPWSRSVIGGPSSPMQVV
jgi:hypothetical protein